GFEIVPAQENVHVPGAAHGGLIHSRYPGGHGVATNHRVGDPCLFERRGSPQQSLANFFNGIAHAFPGNIGIMASRHDLHLPKDQVARQPYGQSPCRDVMPLQSWDCLTLACSSVRSRDRLLMIRKGLRTVQRKYLTELRSSIKLNAP